MQTYFTTNRSSGTYESSTKDKGRSLDMKVSYKCSSDQIAKSVPMAEHILMHYIAVRCKITMYKMSKL